MKEFKIFEKHFVWTRTWKINVALCSLLVVTFVLSRLLGNPFVVGNLLLISLILFIAGGALKFWNMYEVKQLKGSLTGILVFEKEYIQIKEERVSFDSIEFIEIIGVDWVGLYAYSYGDIDYENGLSNGTDNSLIIRFKDKKVRKIRFQMHSACEFQEIEEVIKHYYINNYIGYLNAVDLICLEKRKEWEELKALKMALKKVPK